MSSEEISKSKDLVNRHGRLYREWKAQNRECVICGINEGKTKDHLPPKCLYPKSVMSENPNFLTYPVCEDCNGGSKDADYLLGVYLAFYLNQQSYIKDEEPKDPDLLALHNEALERLSSEEEGGRRRGLLVPHIYFNEEANAHGFNPDKLQVHVTLVKIVKAIYWLQTGGDVLQKYKPRWWIYPRINTSVSIYVSKYLKQTESEIHWGDRFIAHYNIGENKNGVAGFIVCSLHFYTNREKGKGVTWNLVAAPEKTIVNGKSLYEACLGVFGDQCFYEDL